MSAKSPRIGNREYQYQELKSGRTQPPFHRDIKSGLFTSPRQLPSKFFYDAMGSALFDRICKTEEYYPTRMEAALLQNHAEEIITLLKPEHIIEFGSGTSRKTRHLFDAGFRQHLKFEYWPFDVCGPILESAAQDLLRDYPGMPITILVGDYLAEFEGFPSMDGHRRMFVFLGGTIGNFLYSEAVCFLQKLNGLMRPEDALLIGFDRVKAKPVLEAAYNDRAGLTAAFNLNILNVVNRELGANFEVNNFQHVAIYNEQAEQIEMYLQARCAMRIQLAGLDGEVLKLEKSERILTEVSRKFTPLSIAALLDESGYAMERHYEESAAYYSLVLARRKSPA